MVCFEGGHLARADPAEHRVAVRPGYPGRGGGRCVRGRQSTGDQRRAVAQARDPATQADQRLEQRRGQCDVRPRERDERIGRDDRRIGARLLAAVDRQDRQHRGGGFRHRGGRNLALHRLVEGVAQFRQRLVSPRGVIDRRRIQRGPGGFDSRPAVGRCVIDWNEVFHRVDDTAARGRTPNRDFGERAGGDRGRGLRLEPEQHLASRRIEGGRVRRAVIEGVGGCGDERREQARRVRRPLGGVAISEVARPVGSRQELHGDREHHSPPPVSS